MIFFLFQNFRSQNSGLSMMEAYYMCLGFLMFTLLCVACS